MLFLNFLKSLMRYFVNSFFFLFRIFVFETEKENHIVYAMIFCPINYCVDTLQIGISSCSQYDARCWWDILWFERIFIFHDFSYAEFFRDERCQHGFDDEREKDNPHTDFQHSLTEELWESFVITYLWLECDEEHCWYSSSFSYEWYEEKFLERHLVTATNKHISTKRDKNS